MISVISLARIIKSRIAELAIALAAIAAVGVLYAYFSHFGGELSSEQDKWGQFGDFVGGALNPMLGFISVLVLVATLNLQRTELKEARAVVKEGNILLEKQLKSIHLQALENTFFKVMDEFERHPSTASYKRRKCELDLYYAVYGYTKEGEQGLLQKGFDSKNSYF